MTNEFDDPPTYARKRMAEEAASLDNACHEMQSTEKAERRAFMREGRD